MLAAACRVICIAVICVLFASILLNATGYLYPQLATIKSSQSQIVRPLDPLLSYNHKSAEGTPPEIRKFIAKRSTVPPQSVQTHHVKDRQQDVSMLMRRFQCHVAKQNQYLEEQKIDIPQDYQMRAIPQPRPINQPVTAQPMWSHKQSVHDVGVIASGKYAVQQALGIASPGSVSDPSLQALQIVDAFQHVPRIEKARATIQIIDTNNADTSFDMGERELLALVVAALKKKNSEDLNRYFVDQMIDASGVCARGRAMRLSDVLALLQDIPILPESVIRQRAIEELQKLHSDGNGDVYSRFSHYIDGIHQQGLITEEQRQEYVQWASDL